MDTARDSSELRLVRNQAGAGGGEPQGWTRSPESHDPSRFPKWEQRENFMGSKTRLTPPTPKE
jgi:hypothetical protein